MRRRTLLAAGLAILAVTAARAAETPKFDADEAVTLSPVALPIVVNGRLANYVFVTVKILLTRSADTTALRDKEPYFRDALVRAAHRTPFVQRYDYNHIDEGKLRAAMLREASAITGPNVVAGVVVLEQTAQHYVSSPRASPANSH